MLARVAAAVVLFVAASHACAGSFGVSPMRLEIAGKLKSGAVTVSNMDTAPKSFQVALRKWTQDAAGNDVYVESKDLVVFPQQFEIRAGASRLVRIGVEGAAPASEAAYRVFIEELPPASNALEGRRGTVAVVGRFGVPVFVKPASAKSKLVIESVSAKGGTYTAKLANTGDSRLRVASFSAGGKDTAGQVGNAYLLAGSSREFSGPLGSGCKPGARVNVEASTDSGGKATKEFTLPPDACRG